MKIKTFLLGVSVLCCAKMLSAQHRITEWQNNKKAAVSITFDDNLPGQFSHALPVMNSRNIVSTFFVITNTVNWTQARLAAQAGHEIGSHTFTHTNQLLTADTNTIKFELETSRNRINDSVTTQRCLTIAYPFGHGGGSNEANTRVRNLAKRYYYAARSASVNANGFESYAPWTNPQDWYFRIGAYLMQTNTTINTFTQILDNAANQYGWVVPLYHAIETGGYANISATSFEQQMDSVASRSAKLWITTFAKAANYHKQRAAAQLSVQTSSDTLIVMTLTDNLPDSIYNVPLTIRAAVSSNMNAISVMQGTDSLSFVIENDSLQFNAVPDGGNIVIRLASPSNLHKRSYQFQTVAVFPNPAQELATMSLPETVQSIKIYDMQGKEVQNASIKIQEKEVQLYLNVLANGRYKIICHTQNGNYQANLIKQ